MDIFIINTDKATDRLSFQQAQMKRLGIQFERIPAITPDNAPPNSVEKMKKLWGWHRAPIEAEPVIMLSYIKAWEKVAKNKKPALILEDDALLSNEVPFILQALDDNSISADYINFEACKNQQLVSKKAIKLTNKTKLLKIYYFRCNAAAYVIYPKGAEILLKHAEKFIFPPDLFILSPLIKMDRYAIEPAAIRQHPDWFKRVEYPKFKVYNAKTLLVWVKHKKISLFKRWIKIRYYFNYEKRILD